MTKHVKTDGDFRRKVEEFNPHFLIYSVVEDVFLQTLNLIKQVDDLDIPHLLGGVFPTYAPEKCIAQPEVNMVGHGEGENVVKLVAEAVGPVAALIIFQALGFAIPTALFTRIPKTH